MYNEGWWILVDRDGLIVEGEGRDLSELEYFAAVIIFGIMGLRKAIKDEMGSEISEISFSVPDKKLIFHVLPVEEGKLFLITAMPESMPLGMIRLRTKEIYDAIKSKVANLKPSG
ncbi:MAG: hypothetical protein GXO29_03055 [Thermotogae bacterium]|nr:hypothetical protein [Thermotogota bacterium]